MKKVKIAYPKDKLISFDKSVAVSVVFVLESVGLEFHEFFVDICWL